MSTTSEEHRGKAQTSEDKGYVDRAIDWASEQWKEATKPIQNTGGQSRADAMDAIATAASSNPPKNK